MISIRPQHAIAHNTGMADEREGRIDESPAMQQVQGILADVKHYTLLQQARPGQTVVGELTEHATLRDELTLLTRDAAHCDEIVATLGGLGYPTERLS